MFVFLLCVLAAVVTGGGFATFSIGGIAMIYPVLGALFISYAYYFVSKRESLLLGAPDICLLAFVGWGLLYVLLSLTGVNRIFQADLAYDDSFIPRQAVYLFVLPAVLLFREDFYMKGMERFLRKFGEILFLGLYLAHFLFFNVLMLSLVAQVFLCWLSLWLDTDRKWSKWIRIAALMLIPAFDGGHSTIMIVRLLFLAICLIPKKWTRIALGVMAVAVFIVIICSFIIPLVVPDTTFSDWNMAWRVRTWKDAETVLKNTDYLGAGYGTSYPSQSYALISRLNGEWQYVAYDGYTEAQRIFVTGPHNSFISVAMRTGIVGIILFIAFLVLLLLDLFKSESLPSKAACFALFAGIMMISFNVGLESPIYLLAFVFCIGICAWEGKKLKER